MHPGRRGKLPDPRRDEQKRSPEKIDEPRRRRRHDQDELQPAEKVQEKGELEDIKADILLKERVGDAKGGRIQEEEQVFPLGGTVGGGKKSDENGTREDQDLEGGRFHFPEGEAEPSRRIAEKGFP